MKINSLDITISCLLFAVCLFLFMPLKANNSIIGDGYQNIESAVNIVNKKVFSVSPDGQPDMTREPAWPFFTSILLKASGLGSLPVDELATAHRNFFKNINVFIYSLIIVCIYFFMIKTVNSSPLAFLAAFVALIVIKSTPRLIFYYNNEALATLFLFHSSVIFLYLCKKQTLPLSFYFGVSLGFLSLTKAQFLYISIVPLLILLPINKKNFLLVFCSFAIVISPWMLRNFYHFNRLAIAERGAIVASVRYMLTVEPTANEYPCMAYAFLNPGLRPLISELTTISLNDFQQHGRCERLNREICYDMGQTKVPCAPFEKDTSAAVPWKEKTQYFFKGYAAGSQIEKGKLSYSNFVTINSSTIIKYIKTYPLFLLRGVGFSEYPLLIILMTICMVATLFTPLWPLPILALSSHLFHVSLTHNIPRYHSIEIPIMAICFVYCLKLFFNYFLSHFSKSKFKM